MVVAIEDNYVPVMMACFCCCEFLYCLVQMKSDTRFRNPMRIALFFQSSSPTVYIAFNFSSTEKLTHLCAILLAHISRLLRDGASPGKLRSCWLDCIRYIWYL